MVSAQRLNPVAGAVHDIPDAVRDFFNANALALERVGQEWLLSMQSKRASAADQTDFQVGA